MATYSVNKVILIGNLTRDPELRYTPQGTAVCSFGLATNRQWTTPDGAVRDDVEYHNIVAWRKLAEICGQILSKGRKVYVSGRLQTRSWAGDDGVKRYRTEIVIDEMIVLDAPAARDKSQTKRDTGDTGGAAAVPVGQQQVAQKDNRQNSASKTNKKETVVTKAKEENKEEVNPEDIPF